MDWDLVLADQIFKSLFGDVRLKDPHGALRAVDGGSALAFVPILFALLPFPRLGFLVVQPDAMIEFARQSADHSLVARVGKTKPTAGKTAKVFVRADNDDRL